MGIASRWLVGLLLIGATPWIDSSRAAAHAIVLSSDPAPGATVGAGDLLISVRFNSRIDVKRSRLDVSAPDGHVIAVQPIDGDGDKLQGRLTGPTPGAHQILWKALSVDGHLTRGTITFFVAPKSP